MKIAVAVTGASGAIYAKVLLEKLSGLPAPVKQVALIWSRNAPAVWEHELGDEEYKNFPFRVYDRNDFMAPFASGSASWDVFIICPCSMGTIARIASGVSNDLITRCADVMLKERRKLICVVRETPYSLIHLKNMMAVSEAGGIVCPATPSFYSRPETIREVAATVTDRVLSLAGVEINQYRWQEE